ncbi:MAG: right-handed parallel beta-helix repeat-containing protein [Prevotella sp.]|nr:right-handed parallel beta-helix repeat-containing protein [Prevotella sp.]
MATLLLTACSDNDSFSASKSNLLTLAVDTVKMDTLFCTVPSRTYDFWVFNNSGDGLRIATARLERGNQSGFRVNVDGTFLNPVANGIEVRKGDSIRIFVEATTRMNNSPEPVLVEDELLLTLESGITQRVNLRTWSWDATFVSSLVVSKDTVIESASPIVVSDSIVVAEGACLTIRNSSLYFHDGAGITVRGRLEAEGCLFRGDRLDHMFDYLPYDRVSGQWSGISLSGAGEQNTLTDCEIRNAMTAISCDSTMLTLDRCIVHNSRGHGVTARNSTLSISYCQLTNTLGDCLAVEGGTTVVDHTTLAQFYPFSANRGAALRFATSNIDMLLTCTSTLITGYEADVVMGEQRDSTVAFDYHFADCILRTDSVSDAERFERILWETPKDSVQGKQHFRTIDEDNLYYDFTLDSISPALPLGIGYQ